MKISISQISKLRSETSAGVMEVKAALEEAKGDMERAKKILQQKGLLKASKKADRQTPAGAIFSYVHGDGRVGVLVKLSSETDFVARNQEFAKLGHELCLQIAAMKPKSVSQLAQQVYIRDPQLKIDDLVKGTIAKMGENIKVEEFARIEV